MYLLNQMIPNDFFTSGSLATLAGCTGIVFVICSGIQRAFNFSPKWLALLVSIVVSLIAAYMAADSEPSRSAQKYIIAFLNGFLIYASATGTNQIVGKNPDDIEGSGGPGKASERLRLHKKSNRQLLTRWFS